MSQFNAAGGEWEGIPTAEPVAGVDVEARIVSAELRSRQERLLEAILSELRSLADGHGSSSPVGGAPVAAGAGASDSPEPMGEVGGEGASPSASSLVGDADGTPTVPAASGGTRDGGETSPSRVTVDELREALWSLLLEGVSGKTPLDASAHIVRDRLLLLMEGEDASRPFADLSPRTRGEWERFTRAVWECRRRRAAEAGES